MKIQRLQIFSANLQEQLRFYRDELELEIKESDEKYFEVNAGYSILRFEQYEEATPYHIAFHIPDKQHEEALKWAKERVSILKGNGQEIIDFAAWNAKSLYFYDKDENIIEFISRESFNKPATALFSQKSILGISEFGLATSNIQEKFDFLNKHYKLKKYDGDFERFCAIGDDQGLVITINNQLKDWFPTEDKAFKSEFAIDFKHTEKTYSFIFKNDKLTKAQP